MKIPRLTGLEWLIFAIAAIGFIFDTYVLLMLPLILPPALAELGHLKPGTPEFTSWARWMFFVPALVGGFFGLIGGYLTDRFGRRRVLTWSILLYALASVASAFATSIPMLLILRCAAFVGVCVEFVAAVAWLAELFPKAEERENVLGWSQAFSSLGGLLVAITYGFVLKMTDRLPAIYGAHEAWRYTLISGVIPAIPLIVIRPFLPESPAWREKKAKGLLHRPNPLELLQPALRRTTLVTALIFACGFGAAFGAIQQLPQIVPGLPEVMKLAKPDQQQMVKGVQLWQEWGGLIGRVVLAILAVLIASRRSLLRIFQVPGLLILPLVFFYSHEMSLAAFKWGVFFCGLFTVGQFSFWGNYLPRVYPLRLRGTGESFAANIGGRMLGTSAAFITLSIVSSMPGKSPTIQMTYAAALVGLSVYAIGLIASFFLPEPNQEELPE